LAADDIFTTDYTDIFGLHGWGGGGFGAVVRIDVFQESTSAIRVIRVIRSNPW
jgi:hypothetical protein